MRKRTGKNRTAEKGNFRREIRRLTEKCSGKNLKRIFAEEENKRHLKHGSWSSFLVLFVIAAVVLVNLIIGQLPTTMTQFDVSTQKLYSLTDDTKDLVKGLEQDVTLYYVVTGGNEDDTIEKMLDRYQDLSSHIKVEKKDPNLYPKFTSQYTEEEVADNSIIVVCGEKSRVVSSMDMWETSVSYTTYSQQTTGFDGEGQITSAISYVTSEDTTKLYWLSGHGEVEETALTSNFRKRLRKAIWKWKNCGS